ncbi:MFS transporter [Sphingomonas sp. S2-65]|uniref:MFS transporter n=1 Tax=Sphingomonas sp. S2-65 TaxID=2903960 RepID=UPI001F2C034F|nr:MFS transporter [Sphingomonas sp. S2-65]UYY58052.1 MFS transporter [Sphingomonas sp. S2-65]
MNASVTERRGGFPQPELARQIELSTGTLILLGLTCAICVANNYYSQPLLIDIARDLGLSKSLSGMAPTLTQLGIALGMLLLLPLGDRIDNRLITTSLLAVQAATLIVMATATAPALYMAASLVAGLCGIVTYLLPAYATRLVAPERRGAVTGMLATGILTGIMLGRSVAGIAGYAVGWRTVYATAALATLIMAVVMIRAMPPTPGLRPQSYRGLLQSVTALVSQSALLRRATLLQALSFGSFNALWVGLTLHLQEAPFHLDTRRIGELALLAVTSAIAAPFLGRLADRWSMAAVVRLAFLVTAAGWLAALVLPSDYIGIVAAMVLVGIGAIGTDVTLRAALYGLAPDIRMRLNAVYSTGTFLGGSIFSLLTPILWSRLGWPAVAGVSLLATMAGFLLVRDQKV